MSNNRRVQAAATLYYVHDPMCSWCWAFHPVWEQLRAQRPDSLTLKRVLGGLAPDTDEPMPQPMREKIQSIWRTIQQRVPGTDFNFDFWSNCTPRRSTYPACRAVIAATRQGSRFEEPMILAIQKAYYLLARNPSDANALIELAVDVGLDAVRFAADLSAEDTQAELISQLNLSLHLGAHGFPSLTLQHRGMLHAIAVDYRDAATILAQAAEVLQCAGPMAP
ncbi:DsbA family protein [Methyloterricola oryzae]|uniref:DsbA family protein n=1 Tax=Methyloterricola oryzae TaxID=1495050 RepID=UPI0005EBBF85|nr:DsbA family protein [Methyloterricola oryzae]